MLNREKQILVTLLLSFTITFCGGQTIDLEPPSTPRLELVSVNTPSGIVEISWTPSLSSDVCGYVLYNFVNNEGYFIDTINDASTTTYNRVSSIGASYGSQSYVVAAFDTSGNISPLSNELRTIFLESSIDSCSMTIRLDWSSYLPYPKAVTSYSLLCSRDGLPREEIATLTYEANSFEIDRYSAGSTYVFSIRANLDDGNVSMSNVIETTTNTAVPPSWINADYATVNDSEEIELSFTIDPATELSRYIIEKRSATGEFNTLSTLNMSDDYTISFIDNSANTKSVNYYRLSALNNCNEPITRSNVASNMVLDAQYVDDGEIHLIWNEYRDWAGINDGYHIYIDKGDGVETSSHYTRNDTSMIISYSEIMRETSDANICFRVLSEETMNPHYVEGRSFSQRVCLPVIESVITPNVFTPDGNRLNDYFKPQLSFTPLNYSLTIYDRKRNIVFSSTNHEESWDGRNNGSLLPEDVYLWSLKATAPSGKSITKTGTITIIFNP